MFLLTSFGTDPGLNLISNVSECCDLKMVLSVFVTPFSSVSQPADVLFTVNSQRASSIHRSGLNRNVWKSVIVPSWHLLH